MPPGEEMKHPVDLKKPLWTARRSPFVPIRFIMDKWKLFHDDSFQYASPRVAVVVG
jgi:hypothetical protein